MNPLKHYHSVQTLPAAIDDKLNTLTANGLFFHAETKTAAPNVPDGFYSDGKPTVEMPGFLYPCFTPYYLGIPYPSTLAAVPEGYSRTASIAALKWLEKILTNPIINLKHFDAEMFTATIDGTDFRFSFPNTVIRYLDGDPQNGSSFRDRYAAVITIADVADNNADWDDGTIPFYVECQARFLLWCWDQTCGDQDSCPTDCYVVRITGNTPGDTTVRVVHADPQKDSTLVRRVCKRMTGKNPADVKATIRDQGAWYERKAQEREDAYVIDDPDFYHLVRSYMETKTYRKELEAESKKIKAEMDNIALSLSCQIQSGTRFGLAKDTVGMREYTVSHTNRRTELPKVNPPLIRQYFPEHAEFIQVFEKVRGSVSIEAE